MKIIVEAKPHETVSIVSAAQERRYSEKELVEAMVGSWYSALK